MSTALANFLFEAVNFLLLAAVLGWVLFKPVRRALDRERDRHAREMEETTRLRAEAESQLQAAKAAREAAEREAAQQGRAALAAARGQASDILEAARVAANAEREALERELADRRDAQAAALAETLGRMSGESVVRLLDALDGPSLDRALVRAACERLRALAEPARRSALVESARPLDAESERLLGEALGARPEVRVVPELCAGVRVTTAAGQVDATAVSLARQAHHAVTLLATDPAATERR